MGYRVDEIRSVRSGAFKTSRRPCLGWRPSTPCALVPAFEPLAEAIQRASTSCAQADVGLDDGGRSRAARPPRGARARALRRARGHGGGGSGGWSSNGNFEDCLRSLVGLKPQVDGFFEGVMVMASDQGLRRRRLALLAKLVRLFRTVADLSEIQAPSPAPATTLPAALPPAASGSPKKG